MVDSDNLVVLQDEDGNDVAFEFLDLIVLDGRQYVVLLPTDEPDESEVVILTVGTTDEDDCDTYTSVDDDATLTRVFEIFKQRFKDSFVFID